jgi:hypothetical protein
MKRSAIEALEPLAKRRAVFLPSLRGATRSRLCIKEPDQPSLFERITKFIHRISLKAAPTLLPKLQEGFNNIKRRFLTSRKADRRKAAIRRNRTTHGIHKRRPLAPPRMRLSPVGASNPDNSATHASILGEPWLIVHRPGPVYHGALHHRHQRVFVEWWEKRRQHDLQVLHLADRPAPVRVENKPAPLITITTPDGTTHGINDVPGWRPPFRSKGVIRREARWMTSNMLSPRWGPWKQTYPFLKLHRRRKALE